MTPVDMTVKHDPKNGNVGDCFRASLASLLDLQPADVPHFMDYAWEIQDGRWYPALLEWLAPRGLAYFELHVDAKFKEIWFEAIAKSGFDTYHLMSGMSPRARHTVVARNGVIVHDPAPERTGLIGPFDDGDDAGKYLFGFLLRTCK